MRTTKKNQMLKIVTKQSHIKVEVTTKIYNREHRSMPTANS